MISHLDRWYRRLILTNFFVKGWGNPDHIRRLLDFRQVIARRETCQQLLDVNYPVTIEKEQVGNGHVIQHGWFTSPLVDVIGDVMPRATQVARFKVVLPRPWRDHLRPVCVQLAGTGDHGFARRHLFMAKPLADEHGIGSILLENPYYGTRRPPGQLRSSLHHVSDLFVMGGALILESMALLNWCRRQGYGPLGVTGVSMGGHMASLAGANVAFPISLVPCMSWTTSSSVFTEGVLKDSVPWKLLASQYHSDPVFSDHFEPLSFSPEFDTPDPLAVLDSQQRRSPVSDMFAVLSDRLTAAEHQVLTQRVSPSSAPSAQPPAAAQPPACSCPHTERFFKRLLDETTHLGNFSVPYDPSLATLVTARYDAYVPRHSVMDLHALWPGSQLRHVEFGHVASAVRGETRRAFRQAIADSFAAQAHKYYS